jgi:hypothetical protein
MKTNGKPEVMARIVRQSLEFAALVAMVLSIAGISGAQSSATSSAAPAVKPAAAPAKAPAAPAAKPAKGQHEGITVHGHWVIEVKNPNGELVTHREFENALSPGLAVPTVGQTASGEAFLSALLTGQIASPPAWGIFLIGPNGLASGTGAPCVVEVLTISPGGCLILQYTANTNSNYAYFLCTSPPPEPYAGISCNLAASPIGTAPNFTGFQLTGSVAATQPGSVNFVATGDFGLCATPINVATCTLAIASNIAAFTGRPLDGNTATGQAAGDPMPVTVSAAGQTIQVTVDISFQ